ncbi:MAG: polyhydroxyalkanoate depolymerase [Verrucomicrobia bacterium]|nr:MAG: polyhydroxyalkanoate depolymerase [Verrucomicrobiota bacterium]TAE88505.1 MAG: polyhydroxyalkanoate depolymerase [Verrucomicrobiota bacterium]TAF26960.1 MAG: polyhydroxyalkanoate depolymerase [Verrucomicrobiota bacterium]TAF42217.1 MAG: polyhydroxyalkanoate depolymerase [Verrucomicrobiota bacterium]
MRMLLTTLLVAWPAIIAAADDFVSAARAKHGAAGERAARFLTEHMPARDRSTLSSDFLQENLDLAFQARTEFPWAKSVPEEIFLNDVLPYAVFDETREAWRADFLAKARPIVKDAKSASEAAQALNREFFKIVKVHYHLGRKRPNQSPAESIALGRATCTGLSILLVDACRAVGIPARAVGTPMWVGGQGNHTWVEIWDRAWHFTGADEYDRNGLNRGWFVADAARAKSGDPRHGIYATSWRRKGLAFPLVWAPASREVAAEEVTARYVGTSPTTGTTRVGVRLFDGKDGERIVADLRVIGTDGSILGKGKTRAGRADLNDMPRFKLPPGTRGWLRFRYSGQVRELPFETPDLEDTSIDADWLRLAPVPCAVATVEKWLAAPVTDRQAADLPGDLNAIDAARITGLLAADRIATLARERADEIENRSLSLNGKTLRWLERSFGALPADGRSLWISMHGGGNAPSEINDQQWRNQIQLYEPAEGIYLAPRAPTDTWNLWHEAHIDPMFQQLIDTHVALRGVNPDKIYLLGYSAGGDGVWQLAPRMADRFAAAAMMAGHPNEASLLGLRNLPFAIFMGAEDRAYDRNKIAVTRSAELATLAKQDPGAYRHLSRIYPGCGHWMNLKDAEALPWMAQFKRDAWPKKIVWLQDDITHDRFYWLKIPDKQAAKAGHKIVAQIDGQTIRLDGDVPPGLELRLSDSLLDLDQTLIVQVNGKERLSTKAVRSVEAIRQSLEERLDPRAAATALLVVP